jgi:hypothetical protein
VNMPISEGITYVIALPRDPMIAVAYPVAAFQAKRGRDRSRVRRLKPVQLEIEKTKTGGNTGELNWRTINARF